MCCAKAIRLAEKDVKIYEDIYETLSYPQLKNELSATTKEIRTCRLMKETGNHNQTHLSEQNLSKHLEKLQERREAIMERIGAFYDKVFQIKDEDKQVGPEAFKKKMKKLDEEEAANPFVDYSMKSGVASYDLLQNEKYGRLDDLKNALEGLTLKGSFQL